MVVDLGRAAEHAGIQEDREGRGFQFAFPDRAGLQRLPEHLEQQRRDHRVDVHAVGVARDTGVEQLLHQRLVEGVEDVALAALLGQPGDEHLAWVVVDRLVLEHRVVHPGQLGDVQTACRLLAALVLRVLLH